MAAVTRWSLLAVLAARTALGASVSAEVTVAPGATLGAASAHELDPGIAPYDGGFFVTLQSFRRGDTWPSVWATRLDLQGNPLDPRGLQVAVPPPGLSSHHVGCGDSTCLVMFSEVQNAELALVRFGFDGARRDLTPVTFGASAQNGGAAAWGGTYSIVWANHDVFLQHVKESGPTNTMPALQLTATAADEDGPAIAVNATGALVAWSRSAAQHRVEAMWLPTGANAPGLTVDLGPTVPYGWPDVATDGSGFLVVWTNLATSTVFGARFSSSGALLDAPPLQLSPSAGAFHPASVTFDGTEYLVAFDRSAGDTQLEHVSPATGAITPLTHPGTSTSIVSLDVAASGGVVAFAWAAYAQRYTALKSSVLGADGGFATPDGLPLQLTGDAQRHARAAWSGSEALVVRERIADAGADIFAARLDPRSETIGAPFALTSSRETRRRPRSLTTASVGSRRGASTPRTACASVPASSALTAV